MLEPDVDHRFSSLCEDMDHNMLPALFKDVEQHLSRVQKALKHNEFLDVSTAERIAEIVKKLLGDIEKYPQNKRKLIVGAARYFVKSDDAQADLNSLLGFDDDVAVLNYVLIELGHTEMRISL
jgi:uncharacterized membrane protein YkvA (DUF1232 family)